ncbi:C40 family peptidase [Amycolatopsis magusensis]|uniref:C40 family peptidase n=1 Tax=Amycolatopsis magusensis TaxID=882444 RepID=UPI0037BB1197
MNPMLVLQAATHLREQAREHPGRMGCLLALLVFGPLALVLLMVGVLVAVIAGAGASATTVPGTVPGIPGTMLAAYVQAAQRVMVVRPLCQGMRWSILAGVAEVESRHAAGRTIAPNGDITPPILGPELDGSGVGGNVTPIRNPDGSFARALGPFQFLSTTWLGVEQDGNDDGRRDPHNAFDAAFGAAALLCGTDPRNLLEEKELRAALYSYNHSQAYVTKVLTIIRSYDTIQPGTGPVTATGDARTVIDAALAQQGVPYVWGGGNANGPTGGGFDCSGLTVYAYARAGITLPRTSRTQFVVGTRIPREAGLGALQPADLVFYSPGNIHHVGIYLGNGEMINAPYTGTVVRIDRLDLGEYAGAVRLLG